MLSLQSGNVALFRMKNATFLIIISTLALLGLSRPASDVAVHESQVKVEKPALPVVEEVITEVPEVVSPLPDFAEIRDVREKKEAFFSYLLPKVYKVNQHVMAQRQQLLIWQTQEVLTAEDQRQLRAMATRYKIKAQDDAELLATLLQRQRRPDELRTFCNARRGSLMASPSLPCADGPSAALFSPCGESQRG